MDVRTLTISGENLTFWLRIPGSLSWKFLENLKVDVSCRGSNLVTYWRPMRSIQNFKLVEEVGNNNFCCSFSKCASLGSHLEQLEFSFDRFNVAATLLCVEVLT
jgi:hypothetical protein